jgi:hypothetical protein
MIQSGEVEMRGKHQRVFIYRSSQQCTPAVYSALRICSHDYIPLGTFQMKGVKDCVRHAQQRLISGTYGEAICVEGLELSCRIGDTWTIAWFLEDLAWIAARIRGQSEQAARFLGAASAIRENLAITFFAVAREIIEEANAATRETMKNEEYDAAWSEGRRMSVDQAVTLALDEADLYLKGASG